ATYNGDDNNNSISGNCDDEPVTTIKASPTITTTATPHGTITLDNTGSPTLNDSADLEGGYNPGGTITFNLYYNGGATAVYTDVITIGTNSGNVSGNGVYDTSTMGNHAGGYTLPSNATVTGSYVWKASYTPDGNNKPAGDDGSSALEQVK